MPFTKKDLHKWNEYQEGLKERVKLIDGKIDKLNLVVPILNRQKVHINIEKTINKISEEYGYGSPELFLWTNHTTSKENLNLLQKFYVDCDIKNSLTKIFREYLNPAFSVIIFHLSKMFQNLKLKYVSKS
jgi:AraC-like DNA-binding protein